MTVDSALSDAPENSPHPSREVGDRPRVEWWRTAVIYQIFPRSFADGDGDGLGDLPGITSRLDSLAELGIDAVWLSPFMTSPQNDAGYDVADYCDVDPIFGTLADFDAMLARAHALGIRIIIDLVPNHSSSAHRWFQEALAAPAGSAERARYMFRDGRGESGELPPNNWVSVFGGPAWHRVTEPDGTAGQWYLHLFDPSQPDFDWTNEWVRERFREILRFWLDRGVDGFRIDVAHGMIKAPGLPDYTPPADYSPMSGMSSKNRNQPTTAPYFAQEGVHEIYRDWHALLAEYPDDRVLCAEAWVQPLSRLAQWVRPDEQHQAFNFAYLETPWNASDLHEIIDSSIEAFTSVGAPPTWVLSNHDVIRHASRLGLPVEIPQGYGVGPLTPSQPDPVLGLRRARAATALMLALPGSAYLYQGEELGLPEAINLPDSARQDPSWFRTHGVRYGRDGCRVPLPWEAQAPAYGFNSTGASWLPQPGEWAPFARDRQRGVEGSTLEFYRTLLSVRHTEDLGSGVLEWLDGYPEDVLAFRNGAITVIANLGEAPVELPVGSVVISSEELHEPALPADVTVWLRTE